LGKMRYRLALDLGSTSLGWAMVRLDADGAPCAVIKAGVRIFSNGRSPKDDQSLAVTRRNARAMRRRRDRLLKRKARMLRLLVQHGFFPAEESAQKALEVLDPYALRAEGLSRALTPAEFGRALFHINQRRGFKSNRKTDKKDTDSGALKTAIHRLKAALIEQNMLTVGQWLHKRNSGGSTVRARLRQERVTKDDGKTRIDKKYDLYIDRAMIEQEFDALWAAQQNLTPAQFNEAARVDLKDALLHQRPLRPVKPGRCTLIPELERAPLALPSTQRFRIYQEVNNLRMLRPGLQEEVLTLQQRDALAAALEANSKRSFTQIKKLLGLSGAVNFNFEDPKRQELKGNTTSAILSRREHFGPGWFDLHEAAQDAVVLRLLNDENETTLIRWLQSEFGHDEAQAEAIANAGLPEGYGSLSQEALLRVLPELRRSVVAYSDAVRAAGFAHHSRISAAASGEILPALPYYGQSLQRHVGFGSNNSDDPDDKRYGRIANPTVHIGLNQVRLVVNTLIRRYGHPSEVIVEVARDLKQSQDQREDDNRRQAENQRRNARMRAAIAEVLQISPERVRTADLHKMVLWEELSFDVANRRCPYSGTQISAQMLFSNEVEIEHILPFSITLDDSLNNKTVALRSANRVKGNHTPWEAFGEREVSGFNYAGILERAELMPKHKRYRFAPDGHQRWLKDDTGFLARALNDTRYLSKVAREYLALICPQNTRVIPGRMTALLRGKFGLNHVLGLSGEKNRNDHRHHAVDACVIAVTDHGLLQRFARATASAREQQLNRLVDDMPLPWPSYREHVRRAIGSIWVSHKPDHGYQGAMHNATAYGLLGNGRVRLHKDVEGIRTRVEENLTVIEFADRNAHPRHGLLEDGSPRPYKGYKGDSNYCIEVVKTDTGCWAGQVVSTFEAYQLVREHGEQRLRHATLATSGQPLVMRLVVGDSVRLTHGGAVRTLRMSYVNNSGTMAFADLHEANVDKRTRAKELAYVFKTAGTLQKSQARRVSVSPAGELSDSGFAE
jgi:CRISPR-associated endonuclease Csn1